MKIEIANTPNPATLKFELPLQIAKFPAEFSTVKDAENSPLAMKLFGFPWTQSVFIGENFVTVTKQDWVDWEVLAEPLASLIREHFERGELAIDGPSQGEAVMESTAEGSDSDEVALIKALLDRDIRPVVAMDGGDVVFVAYAEGVLSLRLKGACSGCPSSQATLKDGIEARLKEMVPGLKSVVGVR